jgi:hypothetical protein
VLEGRRCVTDIEILRLDSFFSTTTMLILASYTEFMQDDPFSRMVTVYIGLTQRVCCKPDFAADDTMWYCSEHGPRISCQ